MNNVQEQSIYTLNIYFKNINCRMVYEHIT